MNRKACQREAGLAIKFALVGLVGFVVDAIVLRVGLGMHQPAAYARALSIFCAMQTTFAINGIFVFKCLSKRNCLRHWGSYMLTNGFGNLCSYLIFIGLISLHHPLLSQPWFAFPASTLCAYLINFTGARLIVFGAAVKAMIEGEAQSAA